ncbi:MAG: hypothetical protein GY790_15295 [Bacteroidetes bacterium]|nr:hypothetical protein [Bacteroidota bacterium]
MKTTIEHFIPMGTEQLMETNGGGFAYDVGRLLRFMCISGGTGIGTERAILDWHLTDMINEEANR